VVTVAEYRSNFQKLFGAGRGPCGRGHKRGMLYSSEHEFFAAHGLCGEIQVDCGYFWTDEHNSKYRLTYVAGLLFLLCLSSAEMTRQGTVELVARLRDRDAMETAIKGWPEAQMELTDSVAWLRERCRP
jgi:hypothetical protein